METHSDDANTESPNAMLSRDEYEYYYHLFYSFVIPSICLCGFIGNFMAVAVLWHTAKQFKQSIYIYMCALTIFDTVYMVISLVRSVPAIIKNFDRKLSNYLYNHSLAVLVFFDVTIVDSSVFMLILMSFERLVAIRNPLRVKDTLIAKKPFWFIIGSFIFIVCIVVPLPFCMEVIETVNNDNQTQYQTVGKASMAEFIANYTIIQTILLNYVPFVAILALNIAIPIQYSVSVRNQSAAISAFNNSADNQLRIMATVFVVTMMYTLLALPQMFIETLSVFDDKFSIHGSEKYMFWLLADITNILANLNMAIDFIIYIMMSKVYRQRFKTMFCPRMGDIGDSSIYYLSSPQA